MKYCPNCGMPLNDKIKCECGYDVETNTVDETYNQNSFHVDGKDNFGSISMEDMARMMGVDGFVTDDEIRNMQNRPIFNKEPDCITTSEMEELMKKYKNDNQFDKNENQ